VRVELKTRNDGQRNCPKHVEFYSKNKFEKLGLLVGFIIRIPICFDSQWLIITRESNPNNTAQNQIDHLVHSLLYAKESNW